MTTTISGSGIETPKMKTTGEGIIPTQWTTATRPATPFLGQQGWNTTIGSYEIYTGAGSWQTAATSVYSADYLVIGGGGSGGTAAGAWISAGGGGAGGYLTGTTTLLAGATYPITVGAGGAAVYGNAQGLPGNSSALGGVVTALGGGGGGSNNTGGQAGGSGGGASRASGGGAGTSGQGNAGGSNGGTDPYSGGAGGGGAGEVGQSGAGARGGAGLFSAIDGVNTRRADGGPGAFATGVYPGGAFTGAVNTGNGGGGYYNADPAAGSPSWSGAGGSGIVIIRYLGAQRGIGGTVTSVAGYTVHTFTSSGTFIA